MELRNRAVAILIGGGVILLGIFLQQIAIIPAIVVDPDIAFDQANASRLGVMVMLPLNFIGLAAAGVIYMRLAGKGWDWIDLHRPGKWDAVWMIGGTVITLVALIFIGIASQLIDAQPPEQSLTVLIQEDTVLIAFMIAMVWLLNAPAEEFVFRNVVQKRLYGAFSGISAVIITSLLFGSIHILTFVFTGVEIIDVLFPILGIFAGSIVMGFAYLRTGNLAVPIVIHGLYNSFQLVILLIIRVLDIDTETAAGVVSVLPALI